MRCNTSRENLETCWRLSACCLWLSCRAIARLTGTSVMTSANHRHLGLSLRARYPRLRLYRLPLQEARRIVKSRQV